MITIRKGPIPTPKTRTTSIATYRGTSSTLIGFGDEGCFAEKFPFLDNLVVVADLQLET